MSKITYRLFGIPIWSITRDTDEDALYSRMSDRFAKELDKAVARNKVSQ